jgi:hypothetical protein
VRRFGDLYESPNRTKHHTDKKGYESGGIQASATPNTRKTKEMRSALFSDSSECGQSRAWGDYQREPNRGFSTIFRQFAHSDNGFCARFWAGAWF